MKQALLTVLCCYFSILALAADVPPTLTVKGIVIDSSTMQPMGYVTVAIQDAKTKQPVKSNLTKDDGSFELTTIGGNYELVLINVGYKNKALSIPTGKTGVLNEGKVLMQSSTNQLQGVTVSAAKSLMKQEVDRISYDVAADPESKALTALDMMRKVPLLTVDASDNILLKGSGNYKILINGKESALVAKNPSDVLRSMPATNIVKIEVITTPPAKYDAEGLAGIINIITKKNADQGYNLGVSTRYNTTWGSGANLNGTIKEGKVGFSGYLGIGKHPAHVNPYTTIQNFSDQSVLSQTGTSSFNGNYKYGSGEFSYDIDSLNLLTASIDFEREGNGQNSDGFSQTYTGSLPPTQHYRQMSMGNNSSTGVDASINYQLGFKKSKDQLLTLSYQYNYSPQSQAGSNIFTDTLNYPIDNFMQYNKAGNRQHTIQVDYAQPFNKLSLEAGGKAIFRDNFSNFQYDTLDNNTGQYVLNQPESNSFNYHQDVYSLYNSYQLKLTGWTAKAGLRLEETTINADFSKGLPLNTSYTNLIPSVSIQRSLKNSSVNFGFTERIQRPDISELNPFIDRSNPQFINMGNPKLQPELNHVFELNYSYFSKGSVNVGLSYAFSNNSIQSLSSLSTDSTGNKITTTTYQNLGSNKSFGLNINTNYPITQKLSLNINGLISQVLLKGYYNGENVQNNGVTGNMFSNISYKFDSGYRVGMNAGYFSGDVNLQGKGSYFIFNSFVFSKDMFNKNASISFVANDPYSKYWTNRSYINAYPDYTEVSNNDQLYRNFSVRVSYKFGKLNSDIKKNEHGIDNDDVKENDKSNNN